MRLLAGFALVLVSIAFTQSQLVVPQINNLNAVISLLPQFQGFLGQLDQILPQLSAVLSSVDLQSLKDKITQVVLSQVGSNVDINAIKDKLRPILQQFLGSKPQARLDFDALLQQIVGAATSALPTIILGLVGKREAVDARININDVLALANKYQLLQYIPQLQQFLTADKLQQLQTQFFATLVTASGNNWNAATIAQAIQQLVSQYVPQLGQSRIDWEAIGQSALNGLVSALPSIAVGVLSIFGKRDATDARAGLNDIMVLVDKFQLQTYIPQIEQLLSNAQLQQLQSQFFSTVVAALGNNWNVATLAQLLQQLVSQYVPQIAQMRIDWESVGQSALNGLVSALPGVAIGLLGLLGKREAVDARININDVLALANKYQLLQYIPQLQQFLTADKLQQLQTQFFATLVTASGNNWNAATIAQAIQQLVSQYVPQLGQSRIDWEAIGQSALNGLVSALPSIAVGVLSIFGKRDATDARAGLNDIMALVDKFQLQTYIPQIEQLLSNAQLQQLQSQFFSTVVAALGNNWNVATLAQLLQQLVSQYVPQLAQSRIDWEAIGQTALNGLASALPSIAIGVLSIFGKRDLTVNYQQLLAQLPVNKLAQIVQLVLSSDKSKVLASLRKLLQSFFPAYQGRINFDDLASNLLNHLNNLLPTLSQSLFSVILG